MEKITNKHLPQKVKIFIVEGGIGKNILFTSILKNIKEKVYVMTAYPDIFMGFENIRPIVYGAELPEDIIFYHYEPYWDTRVFKKQIHLKDSWADGLNKLYKLNLKASNLPKLNIDKVEQIINDYKSYKTLLEGQDYIILQITGQQSPINYTNQKYMNNPKNYNQSKQLIKLINQKFPKLKILLYGLKNEVAHLTDDKELKNLVNLEIPYIIWFMLLKDAKTFIGIDSSLQHAAAALNKKGIVIWKNTPVEVIGWDIHINLKSENAGMWRPYVRQVDAVAIRKNENGQLIQIPKIYNGKEVEPEKIIKHLENLIKEV